MGSDVTKVNIWTSMLLGIIFVASVLLPFRAQASVFSFISDLFSPAEAKIVEEEPQLTNLQNMALLQAIISPDQNSSSTKDEVTIVDGTSLLPDSQKPADTKTLSEDQISLYVVHKGDTLPAIAKMFGVTVNTIRWGNDIKDSTISVGQTLVILPISGIQHTVKSGDTVQSITKLYKGDLDEVLQYNNLSKSSKLAIGDIVVVPDGEITAVSPSSNKSNNTGVGSKGSIIPTYQGYYMRPIVGGIKTQSIHGHNGIDLASALGTPIMASADGEILIARGSGWNGGYGSYVVIKHANGTQTLYGHMSSVSISAGSHVEQGQIIGRMGTTGKSTGVHLHFEIRGARNPF